MELRPGFFEAHYRLGKALAASGHLDEALACYRKAVELQPRFPEAQYGLARTLAACGQPEEAVLHYRQALEVRPAYVEALDNLAWLLATGPKVSLRNGAEAVILRAEPAVDRRQGTGDARHPGRRLRRGGAVSRGLGGRAPALRLAAERKDRDLANELRAHIALYETGKPFREALPR